MARHQAAARRIAAALLAATTAALLLAACGISPEEDPRQIALEQSSTTTTTETDEDAATVELDMWFRQYSIPEDRYMLVPIPVDVVVGDSGEPTPGVVLETLLGGVPAEYVDRDVSSAIPSEVTISGPPDEPDEGVLTIDLDAAIDLQGAGTRLAYGQIVCTAVLLDGVESVRFTVQGEGIDPLDGSGVARSDPLNCDDYAQRILPTALPAADEADDQTGG
jgi:spore germination protein GerM